MGRDRLKILWIRAAILTPPRDPARSPPAHLSARIEGDYLAVWTIDGAAQARAIEPTLESYFGRFRFHYVRRLRWPTPLRQLREIAFYISRGLRLARKSPYDAIVAYGPYSTGYSAWVLSRLIGAPFVLEIMGDPWKSFAVEDELGGGLKAWLSPRIAGFLLRRADHVRLLFPQQIPPEVTARPRSAFHNFVPVSSIHRGSDAERRPYLVLIGSPLYLKGADLLIRAFLRLADDFPGWSLKLVGHAPDYTLFEELRGGHPNVEILGPVRHGETLELLRSASLLVHPSRTEGMPRVLLEAMASGTPTLSSRVGGIPYYIRDGETGILFQPGDVDDLEKKLRGLLSDPEAARAIADRAFRYVHQELNEARYVERFATMLETASASGRRRAAGSFPARMGTRAR